MTLAAVEGRRLFTKLTAESFNPLKADAAYLRKATNGSNRLRDAILLAKGIVPLPLNGRPLPLPKLPEPCEVCGAPTKPRLLIAHIMATVAAYYGLPPETMTSSQQYFRVARPRQIAMYLASKLTGHSLAEIGRRFSRDHSTVIHAIKVVDQRIQGDAQVLIDVEVLRERLAG